MIDLTEKLKKGELPYAEYYIKLGGGEYTNDVWDVDGWQSFNKEGDVVAEVIAPVPSYEEWQQLKEYERIVISYNMKPIDYDIACETVNKLLDERKTLKDENAQLKELLKDCKPYVNSRLMETRERLNKPYTATDKVLHKKAEKLITKIDEALK